MVNYFTRRTIEALRYYVYGLRYPNSKKYFYIGKGKRNRVFSHLKQTTKKGIRDPKFDIINELRSVGGPEVDIIRHNLTESEALALEASLIDVLGVKQIANKVRGHDAEEFGLMSPSDVAALYRGRKFEKKIPAVCFKINKAWSKNMSDRQLYDAVRGTWKLSGKTIQKVEYGIGLCYGVIRAIYKIQRWYRIESRQRWRFSGVPAENLQKYIGYSLKHHPKHRVAGPIFYINIDV